VLATAFWSQPSFISSSGAMCKQRSAVQDRIQVSIPLRNTPWTIMPRKPKSQATQADLRRLLVLSSKTWQPANRCGMAAEKLVFASNLPGGRPNHALLSSLLEDGVPLTLAPLEFFSMLFSHAFVVLHVLGQLPLPALIAIMERATFVFS